MATIEDYKSGKIVERIHVTLDTYKKLKNISPESKVGKALLSEIEKLEPLEIDIEKAVEYINDADQCAVGERVCNVLHDDVEHVESVFLNGLAQGLVEVAKARFASKEEAIEALKKNPTFPIIISRVSGEYMEICRSLPKNCVYWGAERCGLQCLKK